MPWLKSVVLDIVVTVIIVAAAYLDLTWTRWLLLIYTPLMLLLKVFAFFGTTTMSALKRKAVEAPPWFFHLLYALNVGAPVLAALHWDRLVWWFIAAGWALIWILSIAVEARLRQSTAPKKRAGKK